MGLFKGYILMSGDNSVEKFLKSKMKGELWPKYIENISENLNDMELYLQQ
jgi:hypothetical protein